MVTPSHLGTLSGLMPQLLTRPAADIGPMYPSFGVYAHVPFQVRAYVAEHGWYMDGSYIRFVHPDSTTSAASKEEPSQKLISNALVYAKELERIV